MKKKTNNKKANMERKKYKKCIFVTLFTSMKTLHDCIFCQPLVEVRRAEVILKKYINSKDVNEMNK